MADATEDDAKKPGLVGKIDKLLVRLILMVILLGIGFAGG